MIGLRQAEVLRAVVLTRSVSGAAALLAVSPAAISRMLRHTEDKVGYRLFERTREGFIPTPETVAILDDLEAVHVHLARIRARLRPSSQGAGRLHIGASPGLGLSLVPKAIANLAKSFPALSFDLEILHLGELVPSLESGSTDAAFTIYDVDDPRLRVESLGRGRMVCLVPEDHPLAAHDVLSLAELVDHDLIGFHPDAFQQRMIDELFARRALSPRYRARSRLMVSACALVRARVGIALLDEFTAFEGPFSGTRAIPLEESISFPLNLVSFSRRPLSQEVRKFVAEVKDLISAVADHPAPLRQGGVVACNPVGKRGSASLSAAAKD